MRKKMLYILLCVMLLTLLPLTGCGDSSQADNTGEIKAAAEGFLNAMQEGDIKTMKGYCDPSLFEDNGDLYAFASIDAVSGEFAEALGMDSNDLSDTTKESLQGFVDTLMTNLVSSYELTEVSEKDGIGTVRAVINYGFDPDKMKDIDLDEEIEDLSEDYMNEHQEELLALYNDGGQDAMVNKLLEDLMGQILERYTDEVLQTGEVSQDTVMNLENQEGKWVVISDRPAE